MRRLLLVVLLASAKTLTKEQYAAKVSHRCLVAADGFHQLHMGLALAQAIGATGCYPS